MTITTSIGAKKSYHEPLRIGGFCKNGHLLKDESMIAMKKDSRGKRKAACRQCQKDKYRRDRIKKNQGKTPKTTGFAKNWTDNCDIHGTEYLALGDVRKKHPSGFKTFCEACYTFRLEGDVPRDEQMWRMLEKSIAPPDKAQGELDALNQALDSGAQAKCYSNPGPYQDYEDGNEPDQKTARALCRGCPVLDLCGAYGRKSGERGIWGGIVNVAR